MSTIELTLPDVLVVHQTDIGWLCDVEGCRIFIARLQIANGGLMPHQGERGPVTIAAHAADDVRRALSDRRNTL